MYFIIGHPLYFGGGGCQKFTVVLIGVAAGDIARCSIMVDELTRDREWLHNKIL